MIVCFAGALSYPLMYKHQQQSNESDMDTLRDMRRSALDDSADRTPEPTAVQSEQLQAENTSSPMSGPVDTGAAIGYSTDGDVDEDQAEPDEKMDEDSEAATEVGTNDEGDDSAADTPEEAEQTAEIPADADEDTDVSGQEDRRKRTGTVLTYPEKEKVVFSEDKILPQYREIYSQNNDFVGWLCLPRTEIDYPVMQSTDNDYYLHRDFYGNDNKNGQLILDVKCDPWTPSYNLVISGHNMKNGTMFGTLPFFESKGYWRLNKLFTFDTLMSEGTYVIFAAFYSADYDENEEGFRYNADIQYELDAETWLAEIEENKLYDTGIDVQFGDEFLTLTTCTYNREDGRFVVVARKVREGEVIE